MSLADATLEALKGFADEVSSWTNQGSLLTIASHIAQIENAVAQDVHAGETAAKSVWAELYGAFHGHATEPLTPAPAPAAPPTETSAATAPAPVTPDAGASATVAADPTPAPSTTEASSAPSATTSASTEPTVPAAPTA